ncbi:unnamed protein product [Prorocentrum cordatum]|uniref:Uncharacterized protein n=1 Tax=Prorocentrum cordatum TaxID=2364126 RepID=A0ABN9XTV8_9DINO|nr:unnamed protein product [Polarella glacialis]
MQRGEGGDAPGAPGGMGPEAPQEQSLMEAPSLLEASASQELSLDAPLLQEHSGSIGSGGTSVLMSAELRRFSDFYGAAAQMAPSTSEMSAPQVLVEAPREGPQQAPRERPQPSAGPASSPAAAGPVLVEAPREGPQQAPRERPQPSAGPASSPAAAGPAPSLGRRREAAAEAARASAGAAPLGRSVEASPSFPGDAAETLAELRAECAMLRQRVELLEAENGDLAAAARGWKKWYAKNYVPLVEFLDGKLSHLCGGLLAGSASTLRSHSPPPGRPPKVHPPPWSGGGPARASGGASQPGGGRSPLAAGARQPPHHDALGRSTSLGGSRSCTALPHLGATR